MEANPGPKKRTCLKFFYWNLNGLAAHDFIKLTLSLMHALQLATLIQCVCLKLFQIHVYQMMTTELTQQGINY